MHRNLGDQPVRRMTTGSNNGANIFLWPPEGMQIDEASLLAYCTAMGYYALCGSSINTSKVRCPYCVRSLAMKGGF
jgi:hypothetical protein